MVMFLALHPIESMSISLKVSKGAEIMNRYNKVPHLTRDTNGKVKNSQLDTTNESQEVSPFPIGDHKAHINRLASTVNKTEYRSKRNPTGQPRWAPLTAKPSGPYHLINRLVFKLELKFVLLAHLVMLLTSTLAIFF